MPRHLKETHHFASDDRLQTVMRKFSLYNAQSRIRSYRNQYETSQSTFEHKRLTWGAGDAPEAPVDPAPPPGQGRVEC